MIDRLHRRPIPTDCSGNSTIVELQPGRIGTERNSINRDVAVPLLGGNVAEGGVRSRDQVPAEEGIPR